MKVGHSKVCVDLSMLLFSFSPELWYRQILGRPSALVALLVELGNLLRGFSWLSSAIFFIPSI